MQNYADCENIYLQDENWFGGLWKIKDFLAAEKTLDEVAKEIMAKNLSPFERFICAYHFATDRHYCFAPKGSPFQACRSYVDVLNGGFCVCVGYATILKRLCEKLGLQCAVQGCLAKDREGKTVNHANCLVLLEDDKYGIHGLYYSDPRMDSVDFKKGDEWNLNMLALPLTEVSKIMIKIWDDDTIIDMNDFQSIYYTKRPSPLDLEYFGKFFDFCDEKSVLQLKYCGEIKEEQIQSALTSIGLKGATVAQTMQVLRERRPLFMQNYSVGQKIEDEWQRRLAFCQYVQKYVNHKGRDYQTHKLDCAVFVYRMFKNFFDKEVTEGGYGRSWTGKILTSSVGRNAFIDENTPIERKINFIDTNCKAGDILFFHRQSRSEGRVTQENYFPGHCGIYLGNHKYIDSRLTCRGNIAVVDIDKDSYMPYFVGFKNIISHLENENAADYQADFQIND